MREEKNAILALLPVDPEEDGQQLAAGVSGRVDIEEEAVFRLRDLAPLDAGRRLIDGRQLLAAGAVLGVP